MAKGAGISRASYFDRQAVIDAVGKARAQVLSKFGAFVRRKARTSIRPITRYRSESAMPEWLKKGYLQAKAITKRQGKPAPKKPRRHSAPGEPPRSIVGLLRENIEFSYDSQSRSVVAGPVRLPRGGQAPEMLEYGGRETIRTKKGARSVTYAPRPYMAPAQAETLGKVGPLWANSVRG